LLSNEFSLSEYTKVDVGWDFAPDPTGGAYEGAYSAPPYPLAGFKGAASRQEGKGGEGRERLGGERKRGRGKEEWGRKGKRGKLVE